MPSGHFPAKIVAIVELALNAVASAAATCAVVSPVVVFTVIGGEVV